MKFDGRELEKGPKSVPGIYFSLAVVVFTGVTAYFAIYKPLYKDSDRYRSLQQTNRQGIDQSKIQPGDMKIWSNPYEPAKK